jgi:hypothetical protein
MPTRAATVSAGAVPIGRTVDCLWLLHMAFAGEWTMKICFLKFFRPSGLAIIPFVGEFPLLLPSLLRKEKWPNEAEAPRLSVLPTLTSEGPVRLARLRSGASQVPATSTAALCTHIFLKTSKFEHTT